MRLLASVTCAIIGVALFADDAAAQRNATLSGRVTADSAGGPVRYAGIRIPELERVAQADSAGVYRIEQLAPGTYVVIAEAPGFRARRARVTIASGAASEQDFSLSKGTHVLATVDVRAKAPPRVSPKMVDFERRRQRGYGKFVTRAELDRYPGRQLEEVLRVTALATRFVKSPSGQTWLISTRNAASNFGLLGTRNPQNVRNTICHAQVVLDGVVVSSSIGPHAPRVPAGDGTAGRGGVSDPRTQVQGGDDPIDLNLFFSDQLEGVEFYPDATMTPMQYRTAASVCGTLMLWTRDK